MFTRKSCSNLFPVIQGSQAGQSLPHELYGCEDWRLWSRHPPRAGEEGVSYSCTLPQTGEVRVSHSSTLPHAGEKGANHSCHLIRVQDFAIETNLG